MRRWAPPRARTRSFRLRPSPSFLANYFWLASICFGVIGTLRFSICKEVTSGAICANTGDPPFYRDPATAFHRYITMVIVSTLAAFLAVLVTFVPRSAGPSRLASGSEPATSRRASKEQMTGVKQPGESGEMP